MLDGKKWDTYIFSVVKDEGETRFVQGPSLSKLDKLKTLGKKKGPTLDVALKEIFDVDKVVYKKNGSITGKAFANCEAIRSLSV